MLHLSLKIDNIQRGAGIHAIVKGSAMASGETADLEFLAEKTGLQMHKSTALTHNVARIASKDIFACIRPY